MAKTKTGSKKISKPITRRGQLRFEFGDVGRSAPGCFEEALAIPGIERWPFDLAPVQLLNGQPLRQAQATNRIAAACQDPRAVVLRRIVTRLDHKI